MTAPVLVQQALCLDENDQPLPGAVAALVDVARVGRPVMLLTMRPERWRPTLHSMDRALSVQQALHQALTRAGGDLDGVIYLDYGLFTRDRARTSTLADLARRFRVELRDLTLISDSSRDLELARTAGVSALAVGSGESVRGVTRCRNLADAVRRALNQ